MRHLIKEPISAHIESQLAKKQQAIDTGAEKPHWDLHPVERNEIQEKLFSSQKWICCYCECAIDMQNKHIEHFFERHDRPQQIYDYSGNMVLSCQGDIAPQTESETSVQRKNRVANIHCGHKKTKAYHKNEEINYDLLLNPMQNNDNLLLYTDIGEVLPAKSCTKSQRKQVEYSVIRLKLDSNRLINKRIDTLVLIQQELQLLSPSEQSVFIQSLIDESQTKLPAFFSTIKQNFEFLI